MRKPTAFRGSARLAFWRDRFVAVESAGRVELARSSDRARIGFGVVGTAAGPVLEVRHEDGRVAADAPAELAAFFGDR